VTKLGKTIYGDVQKAYDTERKQFVAIKSSKLCQDIKRGEDPRKEASILEELKQSSTHPGKSYITHLIATYEVKDNESDETIHLMILCYKDGGDLLQKILSLDKQRRVMRFSAIQRYLRMMAKGLSYLHHLGISHLDLSLENILISKDYDLSICDFGQAEKQRWIKCDKKFRKGKDKYISPEVGALEDYDGFKADVWSLGIIFWAMLTNSLLYHLPLPEDKRYQYMMKGRDGLKSLLESDGIADVPPSALHLLSKMLTIDVDQRYLIDDVLAHPWINETLSSIDKVSESTPE